MGPPMTSEPASLSRLVEGVCAGSPEAARELFERYSRRLTRLAGQHLSRRLAARLDAEDVVQSVFRTLFRRGARGEFQIDSTSALWRLLVTITVRKARAQARRHTAAARSVAAEASAAADLAAELGREPGPEETAVFVEQFTTLLRGLPDWYARVVELRLQGESVADIASELGVSRQTVYRALDLLRQRLEEQHQKNFGTM
ncbi:hypothetical protein AYO40_02720 [Planctomycetaceae bacterium SCGC AG-212-D15]|nr:hypothetical protein AYO40_02720 [Planctomycetaceae bacterium SCGC AG-212-D15]